MYSEMLLMRGWTLRADTLPQDADQPEHKAGFSLPGAQALMAFGDLLFDAPQDDPPPQAAQEEDDEETALFSLPGFLPDGTAGSASLSREIDFGALSGSHATLEIDQLCGAGRILLGKKTLLSFSGGAGAVIDLTDALRRGKKQTLCIEFDDAQQAGIFGAALLHTTDGARMTRIRLAPHAQQQTLDVEIAFMPDRPGEYAVRAALGGVQEGAAAPWRETSLHADGEQTVRFSLSMRASRFAAGQPQSPPVLKLCVFRRAARGPGALCDCRTLMTGYPCDAPKVYLPLTREDCAGNPDALMDAMKALHAPALLAPDGAPNLLYRRATFAGVAILTHEKERIFAPAACAAPKDAKPPKALSPAAMCWQLCGMPGMPSMPPAGTTDAELLADAAGTAVQPDDPHVARTLEDLRAFQLRLRAEAARQGQYTGALCQIGEWRKATIADALSQALAPLHLSVLPLRGAWWAGSVFSATAHVFIPEDERCGAYSAQLDLLGERGEIIASLCRDVSVLGGALGVIRGRLPDHACVLTLRARLLRSGAVIETQTLPVYVGERGALQAAFFPPEAQHDR